MKSFRILLLAAGLMAAPAAFSQEPVNEPEAPHGEAEPGNEVNYWNWANFAILALGLGYLIGKNAGPMFTARTRRIRKDMIEADDARQEADTRVAEVERRLANLEAEIAALRAEAAREADAETARLARHTEIETAKIQAHAEQEIAAAARAARLELKGYAAQLAVSLAERKIRDRMTPDAQEMLVRGFVQNIQ
jgi:F-type H+-transporting ATPase subunit b